MSVVVRRESRLTTRDVDVTNYFLDRGLALKCSEILN